MTVDSCTKSNLKLTLNDAAQDGIIYIQGQGAACKQLTSTGSNTHEFNFVACGIAWVSIQNQGNIIYKYKILSVSIDSNLHRNEVKNVFFHLVYTGNSATACFFYF